LVGRIQTIQDAAAAIVTPAFREAIPGTPAERQAAALRLLQHASAVLVRGAWWQRNRHSTPAPADDFALAFKKHLQPAVKIPDATFDLAVGAVTADQAWVKAYQDFFSSPLQGFSLASPGGTTAGVDQFGVTRVTATSTATIQAQKTIFDYAKQADPQGWSTTVPETYHLTYYFDPGSLPILPSTLLDPTPLPRSNPPPPPPLPPFFEDADIAWMPGMPITESRNVLNIDEFKVDPSTVTIEYSLYESLTIAVLGATSQAGIDSDNGGASVVLQPGHGAVPGVVTVTTSKNLRFSEAAPFPVEMNLLALPFLRYWLSLVTSFSALG